MGKPTGYLEYRRVENPFRAELDRLRDYNDLHEALPTQLRHIQASRCMGCGVPFCQSHYGCPLHNLIPEWNDLLCRGREREALARLIKTASFPEFTGRVCPALCEKACNLSTEGASTNRDNELYLIEEGFRRGWIAPKPPARRSGKRVAVIGSGPSGLAAADRLNRMGHSVVVIERADRPGGLLTYGIPNMKLPKEIVARRIRFMEAEGVQFLLNTHADPELLDEFDATILCGGARRARRLNVPGEEMGGVCLAVDFLTENTKALLERRAPTISAHGKRVIIVGGGDTGNDCVGTCLRQGCADLIELEMMPAAPRLRANDNPWPEWPRTLRTDYGQLECAQVFGRDPRLFETTILRLHPNGSGDIERATIARLKRQPDGKLAPIMDTAREVGCELLIIAAGFLGCEAETADAFEVKRTPRGYPETLNQSHQIRDRLFTAGDFRTGQSLVVRAIADGRACADEVNVYLMKK
ncbi:MAG: glutamate synthase subunit beta [Clostridia bacterium]|nr:glutamate synthase subunit beta [Clostridia bacterium]